MSTSRRSTVTTGAVSATFPNATGGTGAFVASLRLTSSTLYVGGLFTTLGDSARTNIGAITTQTGSVSAWAPSTDGIVYAVDVSVGGTVYVGGAFTHATGGAGTFERTYAAAFNGSSGAVTVWDPGPDNRVYALQVVGSTVYAGGAFTDIGATPDSRNGLAAVTAASGDLASWNPHLNLGAQVYSISAPGSAATVYAGGSFTSANTSTQRDNLAGFEAATRERNGPLVDRRRERRRARPLGHDARGRRRVPHGRRRQRLDGGAAAPLRTWRPST